MGRCVKCLVLTPMLVLGLACLLYVPVYQGYEGELKLHAVLASLKLSQTLAYAVELTGAETFFNMTRKQLAMVTSIEPYFFTGRVQATDAEFDGIPVRIYRPTKAEGDLPGVVFFHGGGWVLGNVEFYDLVVRPLTNAVEAVFVSVEYRLSPEHKFPVPFEDSSRATLFFLQHAADFNVDPTRIALAGDSAGGNLAAAISLKLSTMKSVPQPCLQVLIYPALQAFDLQTPSYQQNAQDRFLSKRMMTDFWASYAQGHLNDSWKYDNNGHINPMVLRKTAAMYFDHKSLPPELLYQPYQKPLLLPQADPRLWKELQNIFLNPYFTPLLAEDLGNVPTAYVVTCQNDVLRDDGFFYVRRLKKTGVKVVHHHLEEGFHAFLYLQNLAIPHVDKMTSQIATTMRAMLEECVIH